MLYPNPVKVSGLKIDWSNRPNKCSQRTPTVANSVELIVTMILTVKSMAKVTEKQGLLVAGLAASTEEEGAEDAGLLLVTTVKNRAICLMNAQTLE